MPLRLKHLEVQGYKSFASKTDFVFGAGVSAIVGPNGSGKCVTGETLVTLADGRDVPICDLVDGALQAAGKIEELPDGSQTRENPQQVQVVSLDPETLRLEKRPVAAFVKRRAPAQLLRVRTRSGREITATPYHPLFTLEQGRLRALKAEELTPGIRLALPRRLPQTGRRVSLPTGEVLRTCADTDRIDVQNDEPLRTWASTARQKFTSWQRSAGVPASEFKGFLSVQAIKASSLARLAQAAELPPPLTSAWKSGNTPNEIRLPEAFTPDLARLLGLLIAEGRSTASNQVWFVNRDVAINAEYERLAGALFGVRVNRQTYKPGVEDSLIYSRTLQVILERLFHFRIASKSADKEIPPQLLEADSQAQWGFLSGLFEGDAYLCLKTGPQRSSAYLEYVSASPTLARQVVALLLRLGVFAVLRPKQKRAGNTARRQKRTYYSVYVYGAGQLRFLAEHLSFVGAKAQTLEHLRRLDLKSNPNLDLLPGVTFLVKEAARLARVRLKPHRRACPKLTAYAEGRCEASRDGLREVIEQIEVLGRSPEAAQAHLQRLETLANSDVYWDEVLSVEAVSPPGEWVYDLCVADTHNFVAGNLIVHNSNVVDGIRWVLGEQSYSLLRGKKTEDMIFAGSDLRPRSGLAQVTLTFDNADGWLPIDFAEVAISRRAYRDGENEYLLNGQRVRLRDIHELLAKCGLAERTYTIIGQGLIDTALSLKAEERRALFEEAAGIGLYRHKREDALKKLDATQRNRDRVLDILAEIKPRLRSLERQAARARDFNFVKDDLKAVLKQWYGHHWHRVSEELEAARRQAENAAIELFGLQANQEKYDREMTALRARIAALRAQVNTQRSQSEARREEAEALTRSLAVADERLRSLTAQREGVLAEAPALEAQLAEQAARAAAAQDEVTRLGAEVEEARTQAATAQAALANRESERGDLRRRESEARDTLARFNSEIITLNARHGQLLERGQRLSAQAQTLQATLTELERVEQNARAKVAEAGGQLNEQQRRRGEAERLLAQQNDRVRDSESARAAAIERTAAARALAEGLRARHEVLEQARAELVGVRSGARALLGRQFPARGVLAEMLNVPAHLEKAVSAALGLHVEGVVLGNLEEVEAALDALGETSGRAALLPLELATTAEPLPVPDDAECLGVAARLLEVDSVLRPLTDLLLGNVLVVTNRAAARRLRPRLPSGACVVTVTGEVFTAAGLVYGGGEASPDLLQQARERRDLSAEIQAAVERIAGLEQAQAEAAQAVNAALETLVQHQAALRDSQDAERRATIARDSVALEAERAAHELQIRREQLHALEKEAEQVTADAEAAQRRLAELAEARSAAEAEAQSAAQSLMTFTAKDAAAQVAHWQAMMAVSVRAVQDAQARAEEAARAQSAAEARLAEARGKAARLEAEAQQVAESITETRARSASLQDELQTISAALQPALAQLAELEAEQARIESGDSEARAILHAAERRHAQVQLEATRKNEELEGLRRRIDEDFGLVEFEYTESVTGPQPLPFSDIVEKLERVAVLPEGLEEQLNRKRGQLRRMGAINPEAEREFTEVRERHDFLTQQVADLEAAKTQLQEVIAEMDVLMEREFRKTFDAVNAEFRETFTRLFGGGAGKLVLTDPEHVATSGVDIQCKLPGKKAQGLSMLSGGERSLTACALVFALLKVNPTPFVVLDEVDAMLDEANVGRYRDMLNDLSQQTQFIIVTHNRNTVQVAETVYGITMGADSASQMISLKLDGQKVGALTH